MANPGESNPCETPHQPLSPQCPEEILLHNIETPTEYLESLELDLEDFEDAIQGKTYTISSILRK